MPNKAIKSYTDWTMEYKLDLGPTNRFFVVMALFYTIIKSALQSPSTTTTIVLSNPHVIIKAYKNSDIMI
ncbi:hypothetical protein KAR48_08835 [bacterium]|nr:hypothetical protein [bacterium]